MFHYTFFAKILAHINYFYYLCSDFKKKDEQKIAYRNCELHFGDGSAGGGQFADY